MATYTWVDLHACFNIFQVKKVSSDFELDGLLGFLCLGIAPP